MADVFDNGIGRRFASGALGSSIRASTRTEAAESSSMFDKLDVRRYDEGPQLLT